MKRATSSIKDKSRAPEHGLGFLLTLLLLAPLAGCGVDGPAKGPSTSTIPPSAEPAGTSDAAGGSNDVKQAATDEPAADATADSVRLHVAGAEEYRQTLDQLRGQVVLVDFWATWCIPCVQQFPHTVQLSQNHRDQGLAVISVSMDDPSEEAKVLQFLKKRRADFHNILGKYGAGTEFAESFDLRGDVPFYKLYDRQGQLRYQFSAEPEGIENGKPISELDQYVQQLLTEEAS